jgi:RNA polymerase sigma-70 factor (ECF subfamily)
VDLKTLSISALLVRCAQKKDAASWNEFVCRFQPAIASCVLRTLRKVGQFDKALAEDLIQDSFVRLCQDDCRAIREFRADKDEKFYGLLRSTAASAVADHFRRLHCLKRRTDFTAVSIEAMGHHEIAAPATVRRRGYEFTIDEIERVLAEGEIGTAQRNRTIFWLHYRDGFTTREISLLPHIGLEAKGVETVIRRLKRQLADHGIGVT